MGAPFGTGSRERSQQAVSAADAASIPSACTCHPKDRPYGPCQQRFAASECRDAARACQAKELRDLAERSLRPKPLRCWLGFHRFATFERLLLTSRLVCVRCGAVHLSTGFDGVTLDARQSRAELSDAASAIEAASAGETRSGSTEGESAVGDSRDAQTPSPEQPS